MEHTLNLATTRSFEAKTELVGSAGLEPATSCL
jgi:hypothetical protein